MLPDLVDSTDLLQLVLSEFSGTKFSSWLWVDLPVPGIQIPSSLVLVMYTAALR
eukprot:SAG11_NODE_37849_length_255_cov_0.634615_1_plen_53_part_01